LRHQFTGTIGQPDNGGGLCLSTSIFGSGYANLGKLENSLPLGPRLDFSKVGFIRINRIDQLIIHAGRGALIKDDDGFGWRTVSP
jgi:hypothetical protein